MADIHPGGSHVVNPLLILFEDGEGQMQCHVYPGEYPVEVYGILLCDAARNIAAAYGVDERMIFELFDAERLNPTTEYRDGRH